MCTQNKNLSLIIIIGLFSGLIIKFFVFDILYISGSSMSPTVKDGDVVLVNKLSYGLVIPFQSRFLIQWKSPKEGDVVIFLHDNKIVIKRVALEGGHKLDFCNDVGYNLLIKDKKVPLSYQQYLRLKDFKEVPEGYILALGDNYSSSLDSRSYGFVSTKNITGKIIGK